MTDAEPPTFRLMYRSHNLIPPADRKREHGALFTQARGNNKRQQITGALLVHDDWFVQTLEGDESKVRALYTHIATDPRHDSVSVLDEGVTDRVFSRWAMAEVAPSPDDPDTPLIAHQDGISPAAGRATTPEQDAWLKVMRDAARGGTVPAT